MLGEALLYPPVILNDIPCLVRSCRLLGMEAEIDPLTVEDIQVTLTNE
jgi:hypothetical protein